MKCMHLGDGYKKPNDTAKLIITAITGIIFGYLVGVNYPHVTLTKITFPLRFQPPCEKTMNEDQPKAIERNFSENLGLVNAPVTSRIFVATNPRGAESLPPGIVVKETDLYLRRLWGIPSEDLKRKPKYLVTFTVGWDQRDNIDAAVKKFSEDFQIVLFHYDGRTTEWDQYEWSKQAIHVSVSRQTKWWYAKRFMHPDIVSAYDYIFIWDEDLGVEHFNGDAYIQLVKKHGLEISQPGLERNNRTTWEMTKRRDDKEFHLDIDEKPEWCSNPPIPPCAAFVEIMAPVFSKEAWRCVWYMIQNDLVHGWGMDFALRRCVKANNKIGVIDSQWIVHQGVPSLGNQGQVVNGDYGWQGVKDRCTYEWHQFQDRLEKAEKAYLKEIGQGS
ncbi:hypothetical protein CTI12_AA034280 [Artemisia annua]|uniref:Trimethylguanosine synthase n=1 Tax=Artemisia annua TaxID=35608 RepID=A0A2U1QG21_ARTAN|nr:hypothetical protein CTI12_AA034280 [Artemisia annua]